ncbi:hypothetical protein BDW22DRAFT_499926 [Trametopsis cervina]|nr:hypothetical protein BDW22DRAFT_499926 [Trametopsis cervina]
MASRLVDANHLTGASHLVSLVDGRGRPWFGVRARASLDRCNPKRNSEAREGHGLCPPGYSSRGMFMVFCGTLTAKYSKGITSHRSNTAPSLRRFSNPDPSRTPRAVASDTATVPTHISIMVSYLVSNNDSVGSPCPVEKRDTARLAISDAGSETRVLRVSTMPLETPARSGVRRSLLALSHLSPGGPDPHSRTLRSSLSPLTPILPPGPTRLDSSPSFKHNSLNLFEQPQTQALQ